MVAGRPRVGTILVEQEIITDDQLETAVQHQLARGLRLGQALMDLSFCTDADIARALADQLEIPFIDLDVHPPAADCVALLPREVALEYGVLPLRMERERLLVAVLDPYDLRIDEVLQQATGLRPMLALAPESQLQQRLRQLCCEPSFEEAHQGALDDLEGGGTEDQSQVGVDELMAAGEQVSTIRIVNTLIADAVRRGASDLHIEPEEGSLRIRCRIDGRMYPVTTLPGNLLSSIVARFKIIAGMDISESRKPQDGSCSLKVDGRTLELRVSTLRGVQGEIVVARLLPKDSAMHDLAALGLQPAMLDDLRLLLAARDGMILTTGPTGSGKTTTLYAALNHLNRDDINIITIEDPVESKLPGINHVQVHDRAGRSFAASLRSVLRQDPDVVMLGEIRDGETAEIACRAALTGHLVLSSLHTQHSLGAVARLMDIGLEPWIVASCLNGVIAQRLVRRNCDQCTEDAVLSPGMQQAFESRYGSLGGVRFRKGRGCSACNGTGGKGRMGVYELLAFDDTMREFIVRGPHLDELKRYVTQHGFRSMEDDAFQKACLGLISPEEVIHLGFSVAADADLMRPAPSRLSAPPTAWVPGTTRSAGTRPSGLAAEVQIVRAPPCELGLATAGGSAFKPQSAQILAAVASPDNEQPLMTSAVSEGAAPNEGAPEPSVEPPASEPASTITVRLETGAPQADTWIETKAEERSTPAPSQAASEPLRSQPSAETIEAKEPPSRPSPAATVDGPLARPFRELKEGDQQGAQSLNNMPSLLLLSTPRLAPGLKSGSVRTKPAVAGWPLPQSAQADFGGTDPDFNPVAEAGHLPIHALGSVNWHQVAARATAGVVMLLFLGFVVVCGSTRGVWHEAPAQAVLAHPRRHLVGLDAPPQTVRGTSPRQPVGSKSTDVGVLPGHQDSHSSHPGMIAAGTGALKTEVRGDIGTTPSGQGTQPGPLGSAILPPQSQTPELVWICPGGRYYHRRGCKRVEKRMRSIELSVAVSQGRRPCPSCKP